jgi:hypothetical protein
MERLLLDVEGTQKQREASNANPLVGCRLQASTDPDRYDAVEPAPARCLSVIDVVLVGVRRVCTRFGQGPRRGR